MTLAQVDAGRHFNGLQYKLVSQFFSITCSQKQFEKDFGIETDTRSSETLKERQVPQTHCQIKFLQIFFTNKTKRRRVSINLPRLINILFEKVN